MANGFKDNGFQVRPYNPIDANPAIVAGPEHTLNYELGTKAVMFDDKLLINLDIYRMLIDGRQYESGGPGRRGNDLHPRERGHRASERRRIRRQGPSLGAADDQWRLQLHGRAIRELSERALHLRLPLRGCGDPGRSAAAQSGIFGQAVQSDGLHATHFAEMAWKPECTLGAALAGHALHVVPDGHVDLYERPVSRRDARPAVLPVGLQPVRCDIGHRAGRRQLEGRIFGKNLANQAYFSTATSTGAAGLYNATALGGFTPNGMMGWWGTPRTFGIEGSYKF